MNEKQVPLEVKNFQEEPDTNSLNRGRGNEESVENLFNNHHDKLVLLAKQKLIDVGVNENEAQNDSEDVVTLLYERLMDTEIEISLNMKEDKVSTRIDGLLKSVIKDYLKQQNGKDSIPGSELVPLSGDSNTALIGRISLKSNRRKQRLPNALKRLNPREKKVINMRYLNAERMQKVVAKKFNVSKTRIQQIEDKALRKLRNYIEGGSESVVKEKEAGAPKQSEIKQIKEPEEVIEEQGNLLSSATKPQESPTQSFFNNIRSIFRGSGGGRSGGGHGSGGH